MLLRSISFDHGLDIEPQLNEEFRYERGDEWIEHYADDKLLALYNIRYVREIVVLHVTKVVELPIGSREPVRFKEPEPVLQLEGGNSIPILRVEEPPLPKACEICLCDDYPNPHCPVHQRYE